MAETILDITPDETVISTALGSVRDIKGNVNTKDPLVSGSWSVSDPALGSVLVTNPDTTGLTDQVNTLGIEGTLGVAFSGTTAAGVPVTGTGSIVIEAGPPATVDLNLTVVPPAPAAEAAPVPETTPAAPTEPAPVAAA